MRTALFSLLLIAVFLPILRPVRAENRFALVIAAGEFSLSSPYAARSLPGPHYDARLMASLLLWRFGFASRNIRAIGFDTQARNAIATNLSDGGRYATYQAIKEGFLWLQHQTSSSQDVVVIYYAGHGTQIYNPDKNAIHVNSEALVPYDVGRFGRNLVLDVEIKEWLESIASLHKTVIIDTCYSGDMIRMRGDKDAEGLPGEIVSRGLVTERATSPLSSHKPKEVEQEGVPAGTTLLSACGKSEKAFEKALIGRGPRPDIAVGEFTWALYQTLCRNQRSLTASQIRDQVEKRLRQRGRTQTPQVLGIADRPLIGEAPWNKGVYVPVQEDTANLCVLGIGWLAGGRDGSWLVPQARPSEAIRIGDEALGWFETTLSVPFAKSALTQIGATQMVSVQTFP